MKWSGRLMICAIMVWTVTLGLGTKVYGSSEVQIEYDGQMHGYNNTEISIHVNDETVAYDGMFPVVIDGRTLVPVREVMEHEAIAAQVLWFGEAQKIIVVKEDITIELWIDRSIAIINGVEASLDTEPKLIRSENEESAKTMVPLRFIAEAFGYEVAWDQATQTIDILIEEAEVVPVVKPVLIDPEGDSIQIAGDGPTLLKPFEPYADQVDNPQTTVSKVDYYKYHDRYKVTTEEAMSSIHYFIWDNKLVIDIDNTDIGSMEKEIDVYKNAFVKNVRSSQFSLEPLAVRVVFDLVEGAVPTSVIIDEERTGIDVVFGGDGLKGLQVGQYEDGDYIQIDGQYDDINVFRLNGPERIVIDLENTINPFGNSEIKDYDGTYLSAVRVAQFNETTTRIVVETGSRVNYAIDTGDDDSTMITFSATEVPVKATSKEGYVEAIAMSYKEEASSMTYDMVYDHIKKETTITFTDDKFDIKGNIKRRNDDMIEGLSINKNVMIIQSNHIYEYAVVMDNGELVIEGVRPMEIYDHIIVIDAGHGGPKAPGTVHNNLVEKEINLSISEHLRALTEVKETIKYYYTRFVDEDVAFEDRSELANDLNADIFVSIHNNAMDVKKYPQQATIKGMEVIVTDDKEQSSTEFDLAELLMETVRITIEDHNIRRIKVDNHLYVLNNTYMPSVLIEYGYISNEEDAAFLSNDENLRRLAEVTVQCLDEFVSR